MPTGKGPGKKSKKSSKGGEKRQFQQIILLKKHSMKNI
jgi:hypothetical protein